MKPDNTPQNVQKAPSTKPSIAGGVLSILALLSAGIAHLLTHAKSHTTVTTAVGKVDSGPIANGAGNAVTGVLSMPFAVGAILFAMLAILFTVIRFGKVKAGGMIWSIIWILFSVWAFKVAVGVFSILKANPSS